MHFAEKVDVPWLNARLPALRAEFDGFDLTPVGRRYADDDHDANIAKLITLREVDRKRCSSLREGNMKFSIETVHSEAFPEAISVLAGLSTEMCADLARAHYMVARPRTDVSVFKETGWYRGNHDRYHLILVGSSEMLFDHSGAKAMQQSEIWWVNNRILHTIRNPSAQRLIHLVFDLLPYRTMWF